MNNPPVGVPLKYLKLARENCHKHIELSDNPQIQECQIKLLALQLMEADKQHNPETEQERLQKLIAYQERVTTELAGPSSRFAGISLDSGILYETPYIKTVKQATLANGQYSLLFTGPSGSGKTTGLYCWASKVGRFREYTSTHLNIAIVHEAKLFDLVCAKEKYSAELNTYMKIPYLIIAELGTAPVDGIQSEKYLSFLHNLIDSRHNHKKPLAVDTNLNFEDFTKRYDERILRRLSDIAIACAVTQNEYEGYKKHLL